MGDIGTELIIFFASGLLGGVMSGVVGVWTYKALEKRNRRIDKESPEISKLSSEVRETYIMGKGDGVTLKRCPIHMTDERAALIEQRQKRQLEEKDPIFL